MSNLLPIRLLQPLHRQCPWRCSEHRMFSSTAPSGARRVQDPMLAAAALRNQEAKASRVVYQEQLEDETNLPEDFGLIPGTIIRKPIFPRGILRDTLTWNFQIDPYNNALRDTTTVRPWYKKAWERVAYEARYCFSKVQGVVNLYRFRQSLPKNRPTLYWWFWNRSVMYNIGKERYVYFYRSLASGDRKAISEMCLSGVGTEARKLIAARKQKAEWELAGDGRLKMHIISNRAAPLGIPGYEETGIQQVVFRIRSEQRLKADRTREAEWSEHFVMQRLLIRGQAKAWKVWGFPGEEEPVTGGEHAQRGGNSQLIGAS